MPIDLSWLHQTVPLWALLVAALTKPYTWHTQVQDRLRPLLDRVIPTTDE
jgi:hypothetical protein